MAREVISKNEDVPVTHKEFSVLKKMISSLAIKIDHKFEIVDKRFDEMRSENNFNQHKMLALLEEQNSRNKAVMDSQAMFVDYGSRIEALEKTKY